MSQDLDVDLDIDLDEYLLHPQPQRTLKLVHAFMNDRSIEHVCEETVSTEDGVLRQEQLIWCIKQQQRQQRQRTLNHVHFKLRAMFLYNMDLEAENMRDFLLSPQQPQQHQFLTPISAVEDVVVQPTIPVFASLNALHIIYEASSPAAPQNQSKKRVVIHQIPKPPKHKRTRRA